MDPMTGPQADVCADLDSHQQIDYLHGHHATIAVVAMKGDRTGPMAVGVYNVCAALCRDLQLLNGKADLYIALNAINPEIRGRANNRIKPFTKTTVGADDIVRRTALVIDLDPVRPKDINSSDDELAAALALALAISAFLYQQWGVEPLILMTGNGYHLYYLIDEPTDSPLPAAVLKFIKATFETAQVTVDASTADAPQLVRLAGTLNRKGDSIEGRPQRVAEIRQAPDERKVVTTEQLASLVPPAPSSPESAPRRGDWTDATFRQMLDSAGVEYSVQQKTHARYDNGIAYRVRHCPNYQHRPENEDRAEFWLTNGRAAFNCPSDQCSGVNKVTAGQMIAKLTGKREPAVFEPLQFKQFREQHKSYERRTIIQGFLRVRDIALEVGGTKTYKTFFATQTAISVAAGVPLFGRYATSPGRVLYADYELFPDDIVKRVEKIQQALGISDEALENLDFVAMRGREATAIDEVCEWLDSLPAGTYDLVVFDAIYRAYPAGFEENSNPHFTRLMNRLDNTSMRHGNAFLLVHHTSKGNQANKKNTDIGSGAGAQSRAVDCHLTLVEHSPGKVLMRASLRSFAPLDPVVLQFDYPIWRIDETADPDLASGNALLGVDDIVALLVSEQPKKSFIRDASNMLKAKGFYAPMTDVARVVDLAIEEGRIVQTEKAKGKKYISPVTPSTN